MPAKNSNQEIGEFEKRILEKVAARLRELRKEKGFSNYEKFSNKYNLNRSQVGKYERGANMNLLSLVRILTALDVSLNEFFSEEFDKKDRI